MWPYSRWLVFYTSLVRHHTTLRGTAASVTAGNIVFVKDVSQDALDPDFAEVPPCKIETNISIDGVEYPIVCSHSVPGYSQWDDDRALINRQLMYLINLGHGMWPYR